MPERVQLSRRKGWRMPPNTVKVDRSTLWGNPWTVPGDYDDARDAVARFERALVLSPAPHPDSRIGWILSHLADLRGKNLACWCPPGAPCHADVLLELANTEVADGS
jgi:hypothetical protein